MCDRILGDVAEQDRREGDAELRRREEAVEIAKRFAYDARLAIAAPDHAFDARAAGGDQRELCGHEEGVRRQTFTA